MGSLAEGTRSPESRFGGEKWLRDDGSGSHSDGPPVNSGSGSINSDIGDGRRADSFFEF